MSPDHGFKATLLADTLTEACPGRLDAWRGPGACPCATSTTLSILLASGAHPSPKWTRTVPAQLLPTEKV